MQNRFYQRVRTENPDLPSRIGMYWSDTEETQLIKLIEEGKTHDEIASCLHRTSGAIKGRLYTIVGRMYDNSIPKDEIAKVTRLSRESIDEAIQKHTFKNINKVKSTEEKIMKKVPIQAKLITIPQSDIMELKLVLFEIRDLLHKVSNHNK